MVFSRRSPFWGLQASAWSFINPNSGGQSQTLARGEKGGDLDGSQGSFPLCESPWYEQRLWNHRKIRAFVNLDAWKNAFFVPEIWFFTGELPVSLPVCLRIAANLKCRCIFLTIYRTDFDIPFNMGICMGEIQRCHATDFPKCSWELRDFPSMKWRWVKCCNSPRFHHPRMVVWFSPSQ